MRAVLRVLSAQVIRWHTIHFHGLGLYRTSTWYDILRNTSAYSMSSTASPVVKYLCDTSLIKRNFCVNTENQNDTEETKLEACDSTPLETARKDIETLRYMGIQVPENISESDLEHFATITSKKGRKKFLRFLYKKELLKKRDKLKKAEKARLRAEAKETDEENEDDRFENRLLLRVRNNTILRFDNSRLAAGMMFGSKIAYDFSYDDHMTRQEIISLVQQLLYALNANKYAKDPFDIHWVGLAEGSPSLKEMQRMLSGHFNSLMVNTTDKDLLEVFPKEKLVYLSSDSPNLLQSYDSDKVYVIGALVDRNVIQTGVSLARAKRHDIEHARLPLDVHLQWAAGAKNLTLDQMMKIMIEINTSGDWEKAFQHVPIRKHSGLRGGPHWDPQTISRNASRRRMPQDGIQRNPSQFVASRAKQSRQWHLSGDDQRRPRTSRPSTRTEKLMKSEDVDEDETDDTLFGGSNSGAKDQHRWFESDK